MRCALPAMSPTVTLICARATCTGGWADMARGGSGLKTEGERLEEGSIDYVIRVHDDPGTIDAPAWDALVDADPAATPFLRHAYLLAMSASGSATAQTGWQPCFLTATLGNTLMAACPLYLKTHSYGEYVFDWAWADAYQRHGLAYYPKLLGAVPFTPVPGARLLARGPQERRLLLRAMEQFAREQKLSSAH